MQSTKKLSQISAWFFPSEANIEQPALLVDAADFRIEAYADQLTYS